METPLILAQQTYSNNFNPIEYYNVLYTPEGMHNGEWTDFVLQNLHDTFSPGCVEGDTLIDFGSGPTIYQTLSACEVFNNIILSDLLEQNLAELQKWLRKDPNALDWTHVIKNVCELEGNRENYEEKAEKLRSRVKRVVKCDALKRNPFEPLVLPPVDCLLACLCLENPCKDKETYCNVLKNFKNVIKPGGHLLVVSKLNATFYFIGNKRFTVLTMSKDDILMAFKKAGYEIKNMVVTPRTDMTYIDYFDNDGYYFIHACNPK